VVVFGAVNRIYMHRAPPQPASTVILVREADGAFQTYLLKRSAHSGFMPGHYVFPGGTVEAEDRDTRWEEHSDLKNARWMQDLEEGLGKGDMLPYAIAAIRETFEEAGIFVARKDSQFKTHIRNLLGMRSEVSLQPGWLVEWAISTNWRPAMSFLYPWSHWITPEVRSRRFDTRFFLSEVPAESPCTPDGRETVHGVWVEPQVALSNNLTGDMPLSPPTLVTLHELLGYRNLEGLLAELEKRTWGRPRCPRLIPVSEGALLLLPWDPLYHDEVKPGQASPGEILGVGEEFSRMWLHEGMWRPVAA
jgi:8-oxo-dGTP pyrophosphatase MutT (NUDIX family)